MRKKIFAWLLPLSLLLLGLLTLLFASDALLQKEKRYPAPAPVLSFQRGETAEQAESWTADHLFGRDLWTGLCGLYLRLSGQGIDGEVLASPDALTERPIVWDWNRFAKNLAQIGAFADRMGMPCDLVAPPTAGSLRQSELPLVYTDDEALDRCLAAEGVRALDLRPLFRAAKDDLYLLTDPHWNAKGVYLAYQALCARWDMTPLPYEAFHTATADDFRGTCYNRSMLWLWPAEKLEMAEAPGLQVSTDGGSWHEGTLYPEHLHTPDAYSAYLDGNHGLTRIRNTALHDGTRLLMVKDSYGNALAPMLAAHFEETVLIDPRAYRGDMADLGSFDRLAAVFCLHSLNTFTFLARLSAPAR